MEHPSRFGWPVLKVLEDIRNVFLTSIPYPVERGFERALKLARLPTAQTMVVATIPE